MKGFYDRALAISFVIYTPRSKVAMSTKANVERWASIFKALTNPSVILNVYTDALKVIAFKQKGGGFFFQVINIGHFRQP